MAVETHDNYWSLITEKSGTPIILPGLARDKAGIEIFKFKCF